MDANLYRYVFNQPVRLADPSGLVPDLSGEGEGAPAGPGFRAALQRRADNMQVVPIQPLVVNVAVPQPGFGVEATSLEIEKVQITSIQLSDNAPWWVKKLLPKAGEDLKKKAQYLLGNQKTYKLWSYQKGMVIDTSQTVTYQGPKQIKIVFENTRIYSGIQPADWYVTVTGEAVIKLTGQLKVYTIKKGPGG